MAVSSLMAMLRNERQFWCFFGASTVSGLGDGLRITAFALLAAALTRDPVMVTLVTVAAHLPWILVGPFTGALVDRLDRRRALRVCYAVQTVLMSGFAVLVIDRRAGIGVLIVLAFLMTSVDTMANNLAQAVTAGLKGSRSLTSANSWVQGGQFVTTEFLGAPLGAALFVTSRHLPFTIDAATFAVAVLLMYGLRPDRAGRTASRAAGRISLRGLFGETVQGCAWLFRHRLLRTVCVLVGLANLTTVGMISISVLYALDVLRVSQAGYGLLMLIIAFGGLAGLVCARPLVAALGNVGTLQGTFLVLPVAMLAGGLTTNPIMASAAFAFVGAAVSIGRVVTTTLRQILVPEEMFGRVTGAFGLIVSGMAPIGALLSGVVADAFGLRAPFLAASGLLAVAAVVALRLLSGHVVPPGDDSAQTMETGRLGK